jgi:hypothetical protein
MAYTYDALHGMTVAQLREIAQGVQHDAVKGFSTMHKEKLLPALCLALGIEAHVHHVAVGVDKARMKAEIRSLKEEKKSALAAGDRMQFKETLRKIHTLKRKLRKSVV